MAEFRVAVCNRQPGPQFRPEWLSVFTEFQIISLATMIREASGDTARQLNGLAGKLREVVGQFRV